MNTELRLNHTRAGSNKHGKSAKYNSIRLSENTNMSGFNIRKQCLEQDNNMLQEHIMEKQGIS